MWSRHSKNSWKREELISAFLKVGGALSAPPPPSSSCRGEVNKKVAQANQKEVSHTSPGTITSCLLYTAETLNKGHLGISHFVLCEEVVLLSEEDHCYGKGVQKSVLSREVVPFSEGPLTEVPLYTQLKSLPSTWCVYHHCVCNMTSAALY